MVDMQELMEQELRRLAELEAAVRSFASTLLHRGFLGHALGTQVNNYATSLGLTWLPEDVKEVSGAAAPCHAVRCLHPLSAA